MTLTKFSIEEFLGGPGSSSLTSFHAFVSHILHEDYPLPFQNVYGLLGPTDSYLFSLLQHGPPQPRLNAGLSSQRGSRSSKGREKHSCYDRPRPPQRCSHRTATPPHRRDVTSQELALVREGSDLLISRAWGLGAPNSITGVTLEHWAQDSHRVSHLPPTPRSHPDLSSHTRMSPPDPTESYLPTSLTGSGAEINQWG